MNPKISEKEWLEDFHEFVRTESAGPVPLELSRKILSRVHRELNPSPWLIFAKLMGVHAIIGTLSLAICNQFGMNPFQSDFSLSEYFMKFGHSTCMFFCGVIFITLSIALSWLLLRPEQFLVLRKNAFLQVFGLSTLSLVAFFAFGAEIAFSIGFLWFTGAMIGGLASTRLLGNTLPS